MHDDTLSWQQVLKRNFTQMSDTSLEPTKGSILKRRVGYGEINEINEEEVVRSEKRSKMDVDTTASVWSST